MSELSPAAQAVFWKFNSAFDWVQDGVPGPQYKAIAAALRAAVDHCHSQKIREADYTTRQWICVDDLLAIAAELESQ